MDMMEAVQALFGTRSGAGWGFWTSVAAALVVLLLLPALYGHAKRISSERRLPDPHVEIKLGLHWLASLAQFLACAGAVTLLADWLAYASGNPQGRSALLALTRAQRTGWALTLSGAILVIVFEVSLVCATNDRVLSHLRRAFVLLRLILSGTVFVLAGTLTLAILLQEEYGFQWGGARQAGFALTASWGAVWLGHTIWAWWLARRPAEPPPEWEGLTA
ncbi:MAG: hypothetical protein C4297_00450 [Gemmataceae bacterium]